MHRVKSPMFERLPVSPVLLQGSCRLSGSNNPLILADEPTGNLDSRTGNVVITLLEKLARHENKTVLVVTHDQEIAGRADQILSIKDGVVSRRNGGVNNDG